MGIYCVDPSHTHDYPGTQQGKHDANRAMAQALSLMFQARGLPAFTNAAIMNTVLQADYNVMTAAGIVHWANEWGQTNGNMGSVVPKSSINVETPGPGATSRFDFTETLKAAGIAGSQGAWFGAIGETLNQTQADGTGMPSNALMLLRAIPNWDNLVGATGRSWNGSVYFSSNSYADANVVYSRHGKNGKLFVVFRNTSGVMWLRREESMTSVRRADKLFLEAADGAADLSISGSQVRLANPAYMNVGYVLTTEGGAPNVRVPGRPPNHR